MKNILLALGALVLVTLTTGEAFATSCRAKSGKTVKYNAHSHKCVYKKCSARTGYKLSVKNNKCSYKKISVPVAKQVTLTVSDGQYFLTDDAMYVVYSTTITNSSRYELESSRDTSAEFTLLTSKGLEIRAENTSSVYWGLLFPVWSSEVVPAGATRTGAVVFQFRFGDVPVSLSHDLELGSTDYGSVTSVSLPPIS